MRESMSRRRPRARDGEKFGSRKAAREARQAQNASSSSQGAAAGIETTENERARPAEPSEGPIQSKPELLTPGLYIVATPLGHSRDVSARALGVLQSADIVAAEDTRETGKLLAMHGAKARLVAYHDHNAERARPALLARLARGQAIALVSDAGTPLISDPGYKLVRDAIAAGHSVTSVPGPSAPIAALVLSGLPPDKFYFGGFLPDRSSARRDAIGALRHLPATLIFFESAKRLAAALADLADILGDRRATVAREITKRYEEVRRENLAALARHYAETGPPRGEIVVVVEGAGETTGAAPGAQSGAGLGELLHIARRSLSVKDASHLIAALTGLPRRQVYAEALAQSAKGEK